MGQAWVSCGPSVGQVGVNDKSMGREEYVDGRLIVGQGWVNLGSIVGQTRVGQSWVKHGQSLAQPLAQLISSQCQALVKGGSSEGQLFDACVSTMSQVWVACCSSWIKRGSTFGQVMVKFGSKKSLSQRLSSSPSPFTLSVDVSSQSGQF